LPATDAVALQLVRYATRAQQVVYFSGCDRDIAVVGIRFVATDFGH